MPNLVYFATFDESVSILRDLCSAGFRVIPESGPFDEQKAASFDTVTEELVRILNVAPVYYLSGSFSHFPVQFNRLPKGPSEGKYAIDFLAEGPLMQSSVGRMRVVDGSPKLLPGDVSFQRQYRNPETGAWAVASTDVKKAFRQAESIIKKRCSALEGRTAVIAPDARKLLESGEARI